MIVDIAIWGFSDLQATRGCCFHLFYDYKLRWSQGGDYEQRNRHGISPVSLWEENLSQLNSVIVPQSVNSCCTEPTTKNKPPVLPLVLFLIDFKFVRSLLALFYHHESPSSSSVGQLRHFKGTCKFCGMRDYAFFFSCNILVLFI